MSDCTHERVERIARLTVVDAELNEEYLEHLRDIMTPTCSDCGYKMPLEEFQSRRRLLSE
jgi:hypothetical protein